MVPVLQPKELLASMLLLVSMADMVHVMIPSLPLVSPMLLMSLLVGEPVTGTMSKLLMKHSP